jgi:hypothetical protein
MTARIQRTFEFLSGLHFEEDFYVNQYFVDVYFDVESDSIREQNIALDRIKYFLNHNLQNSVFVDSKETETVEKYMNAGMRVCTLPEEPYDQIIGIMLFVKLNSIAEGRLLITDINISSGMSDEVTCCFNSEDSIGPFVTKGWWNHRSPKINNFTGTSKGKKVVKISKTKADWSDLGLNWEPSSVNTIQPMNSEVVLKIFPTTGKTDNTVL